MRTHVRWALLLCCLAGSIAKAQTAPPVIFFSDLTFAPNTGGETVSGYSGAYVTLYGNFFGTSQGTSTITWNGTDCLRVVSWGSSWRWYQTIVVQLGSSCSAGTGNFVVTVSGQPSNGVAFTVGSGNIYFISTTGSDSNKGSFSSPWQTIPHAVETAGTSAGNIIYAMNGIQATTDDGQGWGAALTMRDAWSQGNQNAPNALVGYPGATVTIGCSAENCSPAFGIRSTDYSSDHARGYWTFAEMTFVSGGTAAIEIAGGTFFQTGCSSWDGGVLGCASRYWRIVGNDISSANASNNTPLQLNLAIYSKVLGNYLHDISLNSTSRLNQALYLSTDADYDEVGWNEIYNSNGRGGIQTHSSNVCYPTCAGDQTGFILHDLSIHDNMIHHIKDEGITVDTVDPSVGSGVQVFNNVIYDTGLDTSTAAQALHFQLSSDYTNTSSYYASLGMTNPDWGNSPAPAWFYNNTVYAMNNNASAYGDSWPDWHAAGQTLSARVANNVLYTASGTTPYLQPLNYSGVTCSNTDTFSVCGTMSGTTNLMYGSGATTYPSLMSSSLNSNPLLVNPSGFNFELQSGSPAIGAGVETISDYSGAFSVTAPIHDIDGRIRPNPPSVGAYEYGSGGSAGVLPPTNLTATVE